MTLFSILLAACSSGVDVDTDDDDDTDGAAACEIEGYLGSMEPENGQSNVFYQTEIHTKIDILRNPSAEDFAWMRANLEASLWRRIPDSDDFEEVPSSQTIEEVEAQSTPLWQVFPEDRLLGSS